VAEKRKPISKKIRFEVFKRDSFKCQYCGRSAPDVILEVDHIVPVAEGGDNSTLNLITSCRDCNRGKSKTLLTDMTVADRQRKQLEEMEERKEQAEMMIQWRKELMAFEDTMIDAIDEYIFKLSGYGLSDTGKRNMRTYINRFGFEEVFEATRISFSKYPEWETAFEKIGGICYNREKNRREKQCQTGL